MTLNDPESHLPIASLYREFFIVFAVGDNTATDISCSHGPSAAAELLVLPSDWVTSMTTANEK